MIIRDNGLRYAKLIHVSVDNGKTGNSNKIYIMEELSDGRIKCNYGRVGKDELKTEYKNKNKWDSVYKQKLSKTKGYVDVTELIIEPIIGNNNHKTVAIKDSFVRKLMEDLMSFANKSIKQNYKVTQESVSQQQIDAAQEVINSINAIMQIGVDEKDINDLLIKLYTIIPRKMDNVHNYLIEPITNYHSLNKAKELIDNEQDTLDTMAGQVTLLKQKKAVVSNTGSSDMTILEQMGISVKVEKDPNVLALVYKLIGSNKSLVKRIYRVVNIKTNEAFNKHLDNAKIKKKRLYWHGSRNENWFNLLQTGLLIRPSGVVHTGSMFGDGCYFADKFKKSLGYSSLRGSRWTNGSSDKGYLALFDVHVGKQKQILHHTSECYSLCEKELKKNGYDSVFAKGGADLINNEYIIYNTKQCTISHLIEI